MTALVVLAKLVELLYTYGKSMIKGLLVFCLVAFSSTMFAQVNENQILMESSFWSTKFFKGTKLLRPRDVLKEMEVNPAAYKEFKKAKGNYGAAQVMGFAGGFLIGWPLGTAIAGGEPQWGLAAAGAGLYLVSIPLTISFTKHANKALDLYNGTVPATARHYSLEFVPCANGAKLVFKF